MGFQDLDKPAVIFGQDQYPLFNRISIETTSWCNRKCPFCPIATGRRDKEVTGGLKHIDEALMRSLAQQLGEVQFSGVAQLFLLNEPLLDKFLARNAMMMRDACPKVSMYISTNGDVWDSLLKKSEDAFLEAADAVYTSGINVVNLNVYDEGPDQHARYILMMTLLQQIDVKVTENKYRPHARKRRFVALTDMRLERINQNASITDQFYDRTGEDREAKRTSLNRHCARTQRHIVVLYDGTVPICCALDPTSLSGDGDHKLLIVGNAGKEPLLKIWNSEKLWKYRYYTQRAERSLPGCDTCNHKMAMAHAVRQVDAPDKVKTVWASDLQDYTGRRRNV